MLNRGSRSVSDFGWSRAFLGLLAVLAVTACAPQGSTIGQNELSDTPTHGRFIWHDLLTDDVEAAETFYGDLLGWQFEKTTRPGGGPYTLILTASGQVVGGMLEVDDPGNGQDFSRWLGYYAVPDVDAATDSVVRSGGEVILAPREIGDVARASAVLDPDGAVVGLLTSRAGYPVERPVRATGEVAWNELVAAEPEAMAALYSSLVSGAVTEEARGEFTYRFLESDGRPRAGVIARPNEGLKPLWLTYFAVEDVQAVSARAISLGGQRLLAPDREFRDGRVAFVSDPGGAVLGLLEQER
ncbi:MAG: VOC family protein [Xanthomonadales bacterium]|jgi:predicted enzyme related to lactoylglutathione lyase|nr:VOC family protein [Xanthomonadales bacterium]